MRRHEIEGALRALRVDPKGIVNRPYADSLRHALTEPWMDGALAGRITTALATADVVAAWAPPPLRAGEAWLLLCDPASRVGHALRWRTLAGRSSAALTQECEDALECAWRGLLAILAAAHRGPPVDFTRGGFDIPALSHAERVDGRSLGVAACFAWLSRALGVAAPAHVAASASVRSDGKLVGVELLAEKLSALRVSAPSVTHVVVASDQRLDGDAPGGLVLCRCATLSEALIQGGFELEALPERPIEDLVAQVAKFETENSRSHGGDRWRALSHEAWAVAQGLAGDPSERARAAEARVWSALFALHAGDDTAARDIIATIETPTDPRVRLWKAVVGAASKIDRGRCDEAVEEIDAVADDLRLLPDEHRWIEGHARGTRGRALLHDGRIDVALHALEETVGWFEEQSRPWEAARTSKDVATCLRLMQRPAEALAVVDRALAWLAESAGRRLVSSKTRDFLLLERGRCLLVVGAPHEAMDAFERVVSAQSRDADYPRLGAVRGLIMARRRAGRGMEADEVRRRCRDVALALPAGGTLGRVAAVAAAEALADGDAEGFEQLRGAWERHFPEVTEDGAIRAVLARQVY